MDKKTLLDLNKFMFEHLEKLTKLEASDENFENEITKSKSLTSISRNIIENAKLMLESKKYCDSINKETNFPNLLISSDESKDE